MKRILLAAFIVAACITILSGCDMLLGTEEPTATPTGTLTGLPTVTDTGIYPPKGKDNYIDEYYATSVKVTDPNGLIYTDDGSGVLLKLLLSMTKNAERSVYLGLSVDASKFYKAEFDGPAGKVTYKFYFSISPDTCYFESGSGRFYKSNPSGCRDFFASEYSEGAYSGAVYPVLKINGVTILPTELDWQYKKYNGEYKVPDEKPLLGSTFDLGTVAANFVMSFSMTPTSVNVKVIDSDGNEIYNGDREGLSNISIKGNIPVEMLIEAVWAENEENNCKGRAVYSLKAKLGASAVFSIDRTTAKKGEFVVISCPNTDVDIKKILVTSDPDIDYDPVFFSDGKELKALVPIPLTTSAKDKIKFTVTAYGNSTTFTVNLKSRNDSQSVTISMISKETLEILGVAADPYKKLYKDLESELKVNTSFSRVYSHNDFSLGYDQTLRARFGDTIKYSTEGKGTKFPAHDYSWVGTYLNGVTAVGDGKVVYAGEQEYTGGLVIVDHGMGLLSWYWNLSTSSIKVNVGDEIKKGTVLGNCGGGGLTEVYGSTNISIHIGLTVFDVPVDIAQLLKE